MVTDLFQSSNAKVASTTTKCMLEDTPMYVRRHSWEDKF